MNVARPDVSNQAQPHFARSARSVAGVAIAMLFAHGEDASAQARAPLPTGERVVAGQATVTRPNATSMVVNQSSQRAVVNWQSFSIDRGHSVNFQQPNASSVILNRVVGNNASEIYGSLRANGMVFLVNTNGVLFAPGSSINVGGLVASTLSISNQDFLAGRYQFGGGGAAGFVINRGSITAAERGTVAMLGGQVTNEGTVEARLGTVGLAAGNAITLDFAGDGLTRINVDEAAVRAQVTNSGAVIADGGRAVLTAKAANALSETVVNQGGIVRARSLNARNGEVVLDGGDTGVTILTGTIDLRGTESGQTGGTARILGHHVGLAGQARVDARGDAGGGTVLIGGDFQGANPAVRNAAATFIGSDVVIDASATHAGDGGRIIAWSNEATRVHGTATARGGPSGGNGGLIETSGRFLDTAGAKVSASAPKGKAGTWLLDPGDIFISAEGCFELDCPAQSSSGRELIFSGDDRTTVVAAGQISEPLNAGTSVVVQTANPSGNITVQGDTRIRKEEGGDASLTLRAHANIVLESGARIESTSGRLNVTLNADSDATNGGAIHISGAVIRTNGGAALLAGGRNASGYAVGTASANAPEPIITVGGISAVPGAGALDLSNGVNLIDSTIDTTGTGIMGGITIRGEGRPNGGGIGVSVSGQSHLISGGPIDLRGINSSGSGVFVSSRIVSGDSVELRGTGGQLGNGVDIDGAHITAESGRIAVTGRAGAIGNGVTIRSSELTAGAGGVVVDGTGGAGGGGGTSLSGTAVTTSGTGAIAITGRARGSESTGVELGVFGCCRGDEQEPRGTQIQSASGAISIDGSGGSSGSGVVMRGISDNLSVQVRSVAGGRISVLGRAGAGVLEDDGTDIVGNGIQVGQYSSIATGGSGGDGRITLTGIASDVGGAGIVLNGARTDSETVRIGGAATTGDIALIAGAPSGTNALVVGPGQSGALVVQTAGTVNIRPAQSSTGMRVGGTTLASTEGIHLSQAELNAISAGSLVLGGQSQSGAITVGGSVETNANLTLQAEGAGGQIKLDGTVSSPDRTLTLSAAGSISQTAPITAARVYARSAAGDVTLDNSNNQVGTVFHEAPKGRSEFVSAQSLVLGSVAPVLAGAELELGPVAPVLAGARFDPAKATGPSEVTVGTAHVTRSRGDLTLDVNINGSASSQQIDLVAGDGSGGNFAFRNPSSRRVEPGPNGVFSIYADTWVGEQRGEGLSLAENLPNLYGCTYQGGCVQARPAVAGNRFYYEQRPTLTVTVRDQSRLFGQPNPTPAFDVSGVLAGLGDRQSDAVEVTWESSATAQSPAGRYPVTGNFVSPAGYIIEAKDGAVPQIGTAIPISANLTVLPLPTDFPPRTDPQTFGTEPSLLYGQNLGPQYVCVATGNLQTNFGPAGDVDPLAIEWSRVRSKPHISSCLAVTGSSACNDF